MIAIKAGLLIDGSGEEQTKDAVVLVEEGKITKVGPASRVSIPPEAEMLDATDKTVMPGMFDCHCHPSLTTMRTEERLFTPKIVEIFQTAEMMKRILHAGFTTIREAGLLNNVGFREVVEKGLIEGPRLVLAGGLSQTGGHFSEYYPRDVELSFSGVEICDGVPEVRKAVRKVLRKGFDFIKVCATGGVASAFPTDDYPEYTEWTPEELEVIVYEASARGKAVMAHAEGTQGIKNAIRAGVWSVEHGDFLDDEATQMLLDMGSYLVPTLTVGEELLERGKEMGLTPVSLAKVEKDVEANIASFKKAAAAGVKIACGTDIMYKSDHGDNARELELMVRHGFTPMQAIVAATKISAEACRIDDKVGTLKPGKLADLLVVDGDPLDDISILRDKSRIILVMKEGTVYVNKFK